MSRKVRLELTPDELHTLTLAGQTKRGTMVKIPKALLNKMVVDHTRLVQYGRAEGILEGFT